MVLSVVNQVDISEDVVGKKDDMTVPAEFTYSVKWTETNTPWDQRMDKYRRYQFLPAHLEVCHTLNTDPDFGATVPGGNCRYP